jgi:hypothetical protein
MMIVGGVIATDSLAALVFLSPHLKITGSTSSADNYHEESICINKGILKN